MTNKKQIKSYPKDRIHKAISRAFIWWQKKRHYLGAAKSPDSIEAYNQFVAEIARTRGLYDPEQESTDNAADPTQNTTVGFLMATYVLRIQSLDAGCEMGKMTFYSFCPFSHLPMSTSYLLKITLKDAPHAIWRWFVVPSNISLGHLHHVIQTVMGWQDSHLHAFIVGKRYYKSAFVIDSDPFNEGDDLPEEEYTLESLLSKKGMKFQYWYDFGDDWMHEIVVENVDYTNPDWPYPICCIEGARACPPEDCGGVYGFADFCEAIADPKHPEHKELKSWYGGKYDPDRFDLDTINKRLGVKRSSTTAKGTVKKTTKKATKKKSKPRGMWVFTGKSDEE